MNTSPWEHIKCPTQLYARAATWSLQDPHSKRKAGEERSHQNL